MNISMKYIPKYTYIYTSIHRFNHYKNNDSCSCHRRSFNNTDSSASFLHRQRSKLQERIAIQSIYKYKCSVVF